MPDACDVVPGALSDSIRFAAFKNQKNKPCKTQSVVEVPVWCTVVQEFGRFRAGALSASPRAPQLDPKDRLPKAFCTDSFSG